MLFIQVGTGATLLVTSALILVTGALLEEELSVEVPEQVPEPVVDQFIASSAHTSRCLWSC